MTTAFSTTGTITASPRKHQTLSRRSGRGLAPAFFTASTPNLNSLYSSHSARLGSASAAPPPPLPPLPGSLARKASFAALTPSALAAVPDETQAYVLSSVVTSRDSSKHTMPSPFTPGRFANLPVVATGPGEIAIGDTVDVPGNMQGTVRFVGTVQGRKGTFAGVELSREFASRGKNNGDVDGVFYFTTSQPGAGIFLPLSKAVRRESPPNSAASFPLTPTAPTPSGLKLGSQNSTNYTPPTPSLQKFSQSIGPGRAASPMGKKPRTSLPRPDSPVRRIHMTPAPRPSVAATPAPKAPGRFGSPTTATKFAQSVRGPAGGDPNKRTATGLARKASTGPRSASALGSASTSIPTDDEATPLGTQRTKLRGSNGGSMSSLAMKARPGSRAASRAGNNYNSLTSDPDVERLRAQLEDRDRQLREQGSTLAEMESSLTELQALIESSDGPPGAMRRGSGDDKDASQLRALLREKNDKIAMLTAEFDVHRADFRSTIDTLEMASTETERVYEKKIEELMNEIHDMQDRTADVDAVASQLKQLEELVQELEEGLEDARRGEAEARGEVEFLRGEVERTRTELRRERDKAQQQQHSSPSNGASSNRASNPAAASKELEQKEDEIRGLKAIIHSLSRDSVQESNPDRTPTQRAEPFRPNGAGDRTKLEQELSELRSQVQTKKNREEELEREVEALRRGNAAPTTQAQGRRHSERNSTARNRDSHSTVVMSPRSPKAAKVGSIGGSSGLKGLGLVMNNGHATNGSTNGAVQALQRGQWDMMPESDSYSTATENSTLWCEICETSGHDILTCTNMFGPDGAQQGDTNKAQQQQQQPRRPTLEIPAMADESIKPMPLTPSPVRTKPPSAVRPSPNPLESGPVAGKESGVIDAGKWCALCERDGHDSVDCPFEDVAF